MTQETVGVIRQAQPQDAERCAEIAVLAWQRVFDAWEALLGPRLFAQHYGDWQGRKRAEVAGFIGEHPEKGVVTEVDGQVVGFLTFYLPGAAGVGEIGNNAVHPDWQGKSIGERQCRRALDIFREMGLTSATVYTGLDEGHAPAGSVPQGRLPTLHAAHQVLHGAVRADAASAPGVGLQPAAGCRSLALGTVPRTGRHASIARELSLLGGGLPDRLHARVSHSPGAIPAA